MARIVDDAAHAQRRRCFFEAAARLIESKGYDRMTVQDVLDDVQQSKGAFYHYFDSKQALVEGLVDDQGDAIFRDLEQHVHAPGLSALDKLRCMFGEANRLKLERRGLWSALLPMWLSDGNAVVRERVSSNIRDRMAPLLGRIVKDGVEEGVFTTRYPDQVGRMVFALLEDFGHIVVELLMSPRSDGTERARVEQAVAAYHDALERVLGAPSGSLTLFDQTQLMRWFERSEERAGDRAARALAPVTS